MKNCEGCIDEILCTLEEIEFSYPTEPPLQGEEFTLPSWQNPNSSQKSVVVCQQPLLIE